MTLLAAAAHVPMYTMALIQACSGTNARIVQVLLECPRMKVEGDTILTVACAHGTVDIVRLLLQDARIDFDPAAIGRVLQSGRAAIIQELLAHPRIAQPASQYLRIMQQCPVDLQHQVPSSVHLATLGRASRLPTIQCA